MSSLHPNAPLPSRFTEGWHVVRAADRGLGWHPQVRDLLNLWLRLCTTDGLVPGHTAIDATLLGALQPYCWMLEVRRSPSWRFRYRMAGMAFIDALGQDVTNQWYDDVRPMAWAANRVRLITTARDGMPTWRRGPMPVEDTPVQTNGWTEIENLMLPLSTDGIYTDTILGIAMPYRPIELWDMPQAAD